MEEGNEMIEKELKEFRVEKSERIQGFCVTNDDYSLVLIKENEANRVCNMMNRIISDLR